MLLQSKDVKYDFINYRKISSVTFLIIVHKLYYSLCIPLRFKNSNQIKYRQNRFLFEKYSSFYIKKQQKYERVFHKILSCRFDWTELGNHAFNMLKEPHNVFYFTKRFKAADNRPENALTLCIWILRIFFGFNEAWNEKYCCSSGTTPDAWVEYHGNILSNIYLCIAYYLKEIFSSIILKICQFNEILYL